MPQGSLQWVYYVGTGTLPTNLGQDTVRLGQGMAAGLESSGETGETATCSLEVDDPAAAWDFVGLHSFYAVENAAPTGSHRLWTGILGKRTVRRGQNDSLRTGVQRRWSIDLVDHNELQARRVITGSDGNRPAETISARLTWLLASSYVFAGLDQGHVQYPTNSLDANDYRGQTPAQVLDNMSTVAGYGWFTKHNELSGDPELFFFDPQDVSFYPSITSFSNVLADILSVTDGSILAPEPSSYLEIDPSRVFSGVYLTYSGGTTYRTRASTATAFGGWRDTTVTRSDVKTLAMANAVADRYLSACASESQRVYWDARTPAANVNDVYEGMVVQFKETHWGNIDASVRGPDWTSYVPVRVLRRNVMAPDATDELYMVHYEGVPIADVGGFHQVVLTGNSNEGTGIANISGSARTVFGGASNANTLKTSGIAQDTDGYAVQIPDGAAANQNPLPFVSCQQIIIPFGLGGTYTYFWCELTPPSSGWYDPSNLIGHPVPFVMGGASTFVNCVTNGDVTWGAELRVNGVAVASDTYSSSGGLRGLIAGTLKTGSINLVDGDVVELYQLFSGPVLMGYAVNTLGAGTFGEQQGAFALTRTGP